MADGQGSPKKPWGCGLVFGLPGLFCLWLAAFDADTQAEGKTVVAVIAGIVFILVGIMLGSGQFDQMQKKGHGADNTMKAEDAPPLIGVIVMLIGLIPTLAGLDIIPSDDDSWHAPKWIGVVAGLMFVGAGFVVLLASYQKKFPRLKPTVEWVGGMFGLFAFTGFAAIGSWVAFGPGERGFESNIPIPDFIIPVGDWLISTRELTGRAAFGVGAVITTLIAAYAWWSVLAGMTRLRAGTGKPEDRDER